MEVFSCSDSGFRVAQFRGPVSASFRLLIRFFLLLLSSDGRLLLLLATRESRACKASCLLNRKYYWGLVMIVL